MLFFDFIELSYNMKLYYIMQETQFKDLTF